MTAAPKIYAIRATAAPIAAVVVRRGGWFHLARWDLEAEKLTPGAWFRGTIYQSRCDLSPDGTWFYYFALKGGRPFHAVSRLPWLTALALWKDSTTYGNGAHFETLPPRAAKGAAKGADKSVDEMFSQPPDQGDIAPLATKHGLRLIGSKRVPYAAERRRGWREHADAARRDARDHFDERRAQWLVCDQPNGTSRLELRDLGHRTGAFEGRAPTYTLDGAPLDEVTWADWDDRGRLLVATREGNLEIRTAANQVRVSISIVGLAPDPQAPPARASRW